MVFRTFSPPLPRNTCKQCVAGIAIATILTACGSSSPTIPDKLTPAQSPLTVTPTDPSTPLTPESALPVTDNLEPTTTPSEGSGQSSGDTAEPTTGTEPTTSEPLSPTATVHCSASVDHVMQGTLELINQGRALARTCGTFAFDSAEPLIWNTRLSAAAHDHSLDMAQHNFFSHTGSDGSSIGDRVSNTGYDWRTVGENIAAGQTTAQQAVDGWFDSPGHCSNLMNPVFTEVAVSCVEDTGADYRYYWSNVLAAPQ